MNSRLGNIRGGRLFSLTAVILLLAVCMTPMVASGSDGASVSGTYDVYLSRGQSWSTSYTYTGTLSPSASVLYSATEITTSSTGWSSATSGSTVVYSGSTSESGVYASVYLDTESAKACLGINIGASCTSTTVYVGVKLVTTNPSQSAYTFFRVHIVGPSFTTGYDGGNFYKGQKNINQVPAVSLGNGSTYKSVTYEISAGNNGKTLSDNTGLSFDTATGKISGTVGQYTNSQVTYTVTAHMKTSSGYPDIQDAVTSVTIGTYKSAAMANLDQGSVVGEIGVSIAGPVSSGITYRCTGGTYTMDGGSPVSWSVGESVLGFTVAEDGKVTGTATQAGLFVMTQNFTVVETGQTAKRTVTIICEDKVVVVVGAESICTYTGAFNEAGVTVTTATHTEEHSVTGSWKVEGSSLFTIGSDGVLKTASAVPAGAYTLKVTYTSSVASKNTASKTVKVYVDAPVSLDCSDADGILYAATSFEALDDGQDSAVYSQTGTMYSPSGTVQYSVSCETLSVENYISISSDGKITVAETIPSAKIGSHTVTVTCTDSACAENTVSTTFTLTIVAALVVGTPSIGGISSS